MQGQGASCDRESSNRPQRTTGDKQQASTRLVGVPGGDPEALIGFLPEGDRQRRTSST